VGKAGLPARLGDENADPNLQMWYLHRSMDCTIAPEAQIVIRFDFRDQTRAKRWRSVLGSDQGAQPRITDTGHDADLFVAHRPGSPCITSHCQEFCKNRSAIHRTAKRVQIRPAYARKCDANFNFSGSGAGRSTASTAVWLSPL
jgi:hypothetical protein